MKEDDDEFFDNEDMDDDPLISTSVIALWITIPVLLWAGSYVSQWVRSALSGPVLLEEGRR